MTQVRTAHGIGDLINTDTVRGRTSYLVKGAGFQAWVDEKDAFITAGDEGAAGGESTPLFSTQFTPDKFIDPDAMMYGGGSGSPTADVGHVAYHYADSDNFDSSEREINEDNSTVLPWDPTPQYPVDMFNEQTIQPGEQEIDPDERLHPSDSRDFDSESPNRPYPGPDPKLFAAGYQDDAEPFYADDFAHDPSESDPVGEPHPRGGYDADERARHAPGYTPKRHSPDWRDHDPRYRHHDAAADDNGFDHDKAGGPWGDDEWHDGLPDPITSGRHEDPWNELGPVLNKDTVVADPPEIEDSGSAAPWDRKIVKRVPGEDPGRAPRHEARTGAPIAPPAWNREWVEGPTPAAPRDKDFNHQHTDPAKGMPRLDPDEDVVYPYDKVSPGGGAVHEMGEGDDPDWYHCDDCGAWHNEFRHVHKRRGPRSPSSDDIYQPDWKGGSIFDLQAPGDMPAKFADIVAAPETDLFRSNPLAFIQRHAHLLESGGLDPYVGLHMDLVLADKEIRTAAWRDVRAKAMRLRKEGRVHIKSSTPDAFYANVDGDNGVYDTIIVRGNVFDMGGQSVTAWHCSCDWGKWAFKRKLTYVGRFCSHAYASYMEMQSNHDQPGGGGTRMKPKRRKRSHRHAGIVEDFKKWAEDNDQPTDEDSMSDFVSMPVPEDDQDDPPYTEEEISKLYDYVGDHRKMTPEREFDVPYTFDPDKVYKSSSVTRCEGSGEHVYSEGLSRAECPGCGHYVMHDHGTIPEHGFDERGEMHHGAVRRKADALRMTPRSLTPDLQFEPEGEDEHFEDVTKDERKTTGPGQIMTDKTANRYEDIWSPEEMEQLKHHQDDQPKGAKEAPDIEHFASVLPPWLRQADGLWNAPGPNGQDPDTMSGGADDPSPDTGGSMGSNPDSGAQDPLGGSGGTAQDNLGGGGDIGAMGPNESTFMASRYAADEDEHEVSSADAAAGDLDRLRTLIQEPLEDSYGHMDERNDKVRDLVYDLHEDGVAASNLVANLEREGSGGFWGPGGPDWMDEPFQGSGADPKDWYSSSDDYIDREERPDFEDVTDLGDGFSYHNDSGPVTSPRKGRRQASPTSDETSSMEPMGQSIDPPGGEDLGDATPVAQPEDAGGTVARRSIRDDIARRNARGRRQAWDQSTLPPGWGTVPMDQGDDGNDDNGHDSPQGPPKGSGEEGAGAAGEAGEAAEGAGALGELGELAPLVALASDSDAADDDILRMFHATAGAAAIKSGGPARGGGRGGNHSESDIANAASQFLQRTAGRNYSPQEQRELMEEYHPEGARNLAGLDLAGTHYVQ